MKQELILIIAIIGVILLLFLMKKEMGAEKQIKETMCTCSGPLSLRKQTKNLNLSEPAPYQYKMKTGGYNFIGV